MFQTKIGNTKSEEYAQEQGVPQGSVLSVTLFLVAINDIVDEIPRDVCRSLYADDLVIYYSASNINLIERKLQLAIHKINRWADTNGYKLSNDKTVSVHFHRKRGLQQEPNLILNNMPIKVETKVKFLGLYLDQRLRFKDHIEYIRQKALKRLDIIKCLAQLQWGADRVMLLRLYRALIRSKIDYGCQIYATASDHILARINSVHNQAIRLCTGAFRSSPVISLNAESGELPLNYRRMQLGLQHYIRIQRLTDTPCYDKIMSDTYEDRYALIRDKAPLGYRMRSIMEELNIENVNVLPWRPPLEPPWRLPEDIECKELGIKSKRKCNPHNLKLIYIEHINFYHSDTIRIFTDGSKSEEGTGCAYFISGLVQIFKLEIYSSVFSAELYAILKVLQFIDSNNNRNFTILTDSKSSIEAIKAIHSSHPIVSKIQSWLIMLQTRHKRVQFCWVPSHIDIDGNEQADRHAKEAAKSQGESAYVSYPYRDFYPVIKKAIFNKWQQLWQTVDNNKLRAIKDNVSVWPSSKQKIRKTEVILTRLRIGHTKLTHGHLMEGRVAPYCNSCIVPLTVEHILVECPDYRNDRLRYFGSVIVNLKEIIGEKPQRKIEPDSLMEFLSSINIIDKI